MSRFVRTTALVLLIFIGLLYGCHHRSLLERVVQLDTYPSASALEFRNGKYYVMGDDARHLLVLDSNYIALDSIALFEFAAQRAPKEAKADIESATWLGTDSLLLLGSGSKAPQRNRGFIFRPSSRRVDTLRFDTLFQRLTNMGIAQLNLEGAASLPGQLLLAHRGNRSHPLNQLVLLPESAPWQQATAPISLIRMGHSDSLQFQGVSGLAYSTRSDKLLLTVSTEDTRNNYDDGAIGKSYLWVVDNFSAKRTWKAINPNRVVDLEKEDARLRGHKAESVSITHETPHSLFLTLAADNDDGTSTLFTLVLEKD